MKSKLTASRKNVRELLEIQQEATRGVYFVKSKDARPILALYVMEKESESFLLVDIPRGEARCIPLADIYEFSRIKEACYNGQRLPLPSGVQKLLDDWCLANPVDPNAWETNFCWWEDPVRGLAQQETPLSSEMGVRLVQKAISGHFPFEIRRVTNAVKSTPPGDLKTTAKESFPTAAVPASK